MRQIRQTERRAAAQLTSQVFTLRRDLIDAAVKVNSDLRIRRKQRATAIASAESQARGTAGLQISSADGLDDRISLGSRLRVALEHDGLLVETPGGGAPPKDLAEACREWQGLCSIEGRVDEFRAQLAAWRRKTFKRASTQPQLPRETWRELDRLDVIHRVTPSLSEQFVRGEIDAARLEADNQLREAETGLVADLEGAVAALRRAVADLAAALDLPGLDWNDDRWATPQPAEKTQHLVRLGQLTLDLPGSYGDMVIPAIAAFPFERGFAVGADVEDRDAATALLRSLILRLFAAVPPGGLHVKVVDPVALGQSVADFRHLAEFDDQLMDEKTWTSERDIESLLDDLSDHLELVISRYLRGQFETIDEYNDHAGEVAQPYRLLTVFDYPSGFSARASKQLLSLIENGPRCGVYTVLHYDKAAQGEAEGNREIKIERLVHGMQRITFGRTSGEVADAVKRVQRSDVSAKVPATGSRAGSAARFRGTVISKAPNGFTIRLPNGQRGFVETADLLDIVPAWAWSKSLAVGQNLTVTIKSSGANGYHALQPVAEGIADSSSTAHSSGWWSENWTLTAPDLTDETPKTTRSTPEGSVLLELFGSEQSFQVDVVPDAPFQLNFDAAGNPEGPCAQLLHLVGEFVRASNANPPAVTLDSLLPVLRQSRTGVLPDYEPGAGALSTDPSSWWRATTAKSAVAPIGRSGAQGVTSMHFSSTEVAGGAIMVGLPRSGKTTSLHAMILGLAMLYSPEELEFYLIDAKHGVEFKPYSALPHARMVSVHSEREFSLAVLKGIETEIQRRAELMKRHGAGIANITEYRQRTGERLSRIVLVIDEFHELFEEADSIGLDAFAAFSNIVRMGPFSGAHVVVASQTLSNMPAMDRPTLTLLPQRITFMCNEYDSAIVMGDSNKAPRLLSRTGEGLFNPSRGEESRNQPFQGVLVTTEERGEIMRQLDAKASEQGWTRRPRVFDGDAVVDRPDFAQVLTPSSRFVIPVGEPFTLAEAEALSLGRTRGANVVVFGDEEDEESRDLAARGLIHSVLLAAQAQKVNVTVVDFHGEECTHGALSVLEVAEATGARYVRSRSLDLVLRELAEVVNARTQAEDYKAPTQLLVLFGIQRALSLSSFQSYEMNTEDPTLSMILANILSAGPEVGVHVVLDADRASSVDLRVGRDQMVEVTLEVAGSAADQADLAQVSGEYGKVPPLRHGQLLIGDKLRGSVKRVRGYGVISEVPSGN